MKLFNIINLHLSIYVTTNVAAKTVAFLHETKHGCTQSLFLTSAPVPKKVTPAPALVLIGNLHSDSCLHSESLKAESILPHEVK